MKSAKNKPTTYAFIDSNNLHLGVKDQDWELDFGRFRTYLKDKYKVTKAFLFIGYLPGNEALYTYLQQAGYIIIFKPVLEIRKGNKTKIKGNVDAELVLHTMIEFDNYDRAVIVSGDGDFHCLLEYLEESHKLYKLILPNPNKFSALLRKFSQYFVYLDQNLKKKLGKRNKKGRH